MNTRIAFLLSLFGGLLLLNLGTLGAAPSLRTIIPQVVIVPDERIQKALLEMAKLWAIDGYDDWSIELRKFANGGWGTGTLVALSDGSRWLVTNRHVVTAADQATVLLRSADGTTSERTQVRVLYRDDRVDLAILEVPPEWQVPALPLEMAVADGQEVWSAGYPDLGGEPQWQLSKGNITNGRVVTSLGSTNDAVFIQHSASIDPGNSGGPLLVGPPEDSSRIRIAGINTWSARGRHNSFYAIPAESILEVIRRSQGVVDEDLSVSAAALVAAAGAAHWDRAAWRPLLSRAAALEAGLEAWKRTADSLPAGDRRQWAEYLALDPFSGLADYLGYSLWSKVGAQAGTLSTITEAASLENRSTFLLGGKPITVLWKKEDQHWKVASIQGVEKTDKPRTESPLFGFTTNVKFGTSTLQAEDIGWRGVTMGTQNPIIPGIDWLGEVEVAAEHSPLTPLYWAGYGLGIKLSPPGSWGATGMLPFVQAKLVGAIAFAPQYAGLAGPTAILEAGGGLEWISNRAWSWGFQGEYRWFGTKFGTLTLGVFSRLLAPL